MNIISQELAGKIWSAHREILVGKDLLQEIKKAIKEGRDATPIDPWGRKEKFQFGIPCGPGSHKLLDVSNELAPYIIEAHIARKSVELEELCIRAKMELSGETTQPAA